MPGKDLLLRVARLSFEEGMTNKEIAEVLLRDGTLESDTTAARHVQEYLDEAGRWLLQEQARLTAMENEACLEHKLAADLCSKFDLLHARVVPGGDIHAPFEYIALLKKYARAAADYFDGIVNDAEEQRKDLHVLVSGGQPILDMVSALHDRKRANVYYYAAALIGRADITWAPHVGSETNATVAWSRSGRIPKHLYYGTVPPYEVSADELRLKHDKKEKLAYARQVITQQLRARTQSDYVRDILEVMNNDVNVAFAGLGIPHATGIDADWGTAHVERLTMTLMLKPLGIEPELLAEEGAVGDISYCLFDAHGRGRPSWKFFITAGEGTEHSGVDFYRNLVAEGKKVIVICGVRKEAALLPALKARLLNVLITDACTAKRLLDS